jgi:S1-C subfamily serine protease
LSSYPEKNSFIGNQELEMQKKMLIVVLLTLALSPVACQFGAATPSRDTSANLPSIAPTSFVSLPISSANPNLIAEQDLLVRLYDTVSPGVVLIQQIGDTGSGLGSGFVYDPSGYVVTNYHVVEGATDLEVDFPSGYKTRGTIKASDLDSDLAVIKVNAPAEQLHPLVMGDSDQVKVGQTVVAIGNPFGLNNTMTMGIVSAKSRPTPPSIRATRADRF